MTLTMLALSLSALGFVVTGALAVMFLRSTETGMIQTTHRYDKLPEVMTDRYIAFAGLALFATLYGDLRVIAALFTAYAFMAFADAFIYHRGGYPIAKHMAAGIAATLVVFVALFALRSEGGL